MHLDHLLIDQLWVSVLQVIVHWFPVDPQHWAIFTDFRHGPGVGLLQQTESGGEVLKQLKACQSQSNAATVETTKTGSFWFYEAAC